MDGDFPCAHLPSMLSSLAPCRAPAERLYAKREKDRAGERKF